MLRTQDEHSLETGTPLVLPGVLTPQDVSFAFLNKENHPRGQLIFSRLLASGFRPKLVIEERSEMAMFGRQVQLEQLSKVAAFTPLADTGSICMSLGIEHLIVENFNDLETARALSEGQPDLVILGDARVLRKGFLPLARYGTINTHPGYLPDVRGNMPNIWAIVHNLPQGATIHLLNEGVDQGPVLARQKLSIGPDAYFADLVFHLNELCADLLHSVMLQVVKGEALAIPQKHDNRMTFRAAPPEIRQTAIDLFNRRADAHRQTLRNSNED